MEIKKSLLAIWEDDKRLLLYKENTIKAAQELMWEKEVGKLIDVYKNL